jgi:FAD/FMN-containing dehydrogenase
MHPQPDSPYLIDASGYKGTADRILIPDDEAGVVQVLREASAAGVPVTVSGAGTGLTGGRVPQGGWVVSLERLNSIEIREGSAVCGAGVLLRDLQAAAAPSRQFYAPDPYGVGRVDRRDDFDQRERFAQFPVWRYAPACARASGGAGEWRGAGAAPG